MVLHLLSLIHGIGFLLPLKSSEAAHHDAREVRGAHAKQSGAVEHVVKSELFQRLRSAAGKASSRQP